MFIGKSVCVFTGESARHFSLIQKLSTLFEKVNAVVETKVDSTGAAPRNKIMTEYFARVGCAEDLIFGKNCELSATNINVLKIPYGQLSSTPKSVLETFLNSETFVVFGSSFIKGDLCSYLVEKNAINVHIGTSPYFRGSACNYWALSMGRPDLVGATLHLLTKGLDSGPILRHAFPRYRPETDAFLVGMQAVEAAHEGLLDLFKCGQGSFTPVVQDKRLEIHYSKIADFTEKEAAEFMRSCIDPSDIKQGLDSRKNELFVRPHLY